MVDFLTFPFICDALPFVLEVYAEESMVYLYFLLATAVFCAEGSKVLEANDNFTVLPTDRPIYANVRGQSYDEGSVWIRSRTAHGLDNMICYRPKKEYLTQGQNEHFFYCQGLGTFAEFLPRFTEDITRGKAGTPWQEVCAKKYHLSEADLTCAAVALIKKHFTGRPSWDGLLHPEFESWARHVPYSKRHHNVLAAVEIRDSFALGDMWVAKEGDRSMLLYRPDSGPLWMCYRYDLVQKPVQPAVWKDALTLIRRYVDIAKSLNEESPIYLNEADDIYPVAKAMFSGVG